MYVREYQVVLEEIDDVGSDGVEDDHIQHSLHSNILIYNPQ